VGAASTRRLTRRSPRGARARLARHARTRMFRTAGLLLLCPLVNHHHHAAKHTACTVPVVLMSLCAFETQRGARVQVGLKR
jgi:hypothetical protein